MAGAFGRFRRLGGRYVLATVASVAVSETMFAILLEVVGYSSKTSSLVATSIGAIPSFWFNRRFVWRETGRSGLMAEMAPFWVLAVISLALSTWFADFASSHTGTLRPTDLRTAVVSVAYLSSFFVTWVAKFFIFDRFLFRGQAPAET